MPWAELQALVEPHDSKGETGRKPVGLAIMLGVYFFLQQWFALSDPGVEDALYEPAVPRRFTGVGLPSRGRRPVRGDPGLHHPADEDLSVGAPVFIGISVGAITSHATPSSANFQ